MNCKSSDSMKNPFWERRISRRGFIKGAIVGACFSILPPIRNQAEGAANPVLNPLFWIKDIPEQPFYDAGSPNVHAGFDYLLDLMGEWGLKFYRSSQETILGGPAGMIESNDVVLIKVNAQWKYRGCTNSDLIRGLIQRILDHPDGFTGEVVIIENGQGRGSLNCDTSGAYSGDTSVHANANDESHSFNYLVDTIFNDPRVSSYLLDEIRTNLIAADNHAGQGYRTYENISYPCFTTLGGHRVELMEGIWHEGSGYSQNLKLINVPVLKIHGGSEITASLKHFYGVLSMSDGVDSGRHYTDLGNTCGKMVASVRTPILNIIDAIWVSHGSLTGYPASTTFRANQILASQDPVALDYWAAKYILYPKTQLPNHLPTYSGIDQWLTSARNIINSGGGLSDPGSGIQVGQVTKNEEEMLAYHWSLAWNGINEMGIFQKGRWYLGLNSNGPGGGPSIDKCYTFGLPGDIPVVGDWNGNSLDEIGVFRIVNGQGRWYLDINGNGVWEPGVDAVYTNFGQPGDIPVVGDWNGDGFDEIGVFRIVNGQGRWYLDMNGNGIWNPGADAVYTDFGQTGDIPVVGDWNGDGFDEIGVFRIVNGQGRWYLDMNGNGAWEPGGDTVYTFGQTGDVPVTGDWNGAGTTRIGVFRVVNGAGRWYLDLNDNGTFVNPPDPVYFYGAAGDKPVTGRW